MNSLFRYIYPAVFTYSGPAADNNRRICKLMVIIDLSAGDQITHFCLLFDSVHQPNRPNFLNVNKLRSSSIPNEFPTSVEFDQNFQNHEAYVV